MPSVPALTYFPGTKTGNDIWVYYNLGNAVLKEKKSFGSSVLMPNCSGNEACPAGSWDASILTSPGKGAVGTFPENAPMYTAVVGDVDPGEAGVSMDLVCFPDWDDNVLLCYDQSFDDTPGMRFRPIPRKLNPADHYVSVRPEQSIRMDDLYVSNYDGLRALNGRRITLILVVMPQGGGAIQEVIYYSNFLVNVPGMTYGADQNASITLSGEGSYAIRAHFSAPKP